MQNLTDERVGAQEAFLAVAPRITGDDGRVRQGEPERGALVGDAYSGAT
jgi:hypothetical protein